MLSSGLTAEGEKMMNRRQFLSVVLPALAAAGCSRSEPVPSDRRSNPAAEVTGGPPAQAGPRLKLTAGTNTGVLCYTGWWVAHEKDFFSDEGLHVELLEEDASKAHGHGLTSEWLNGPAGPVRNDLMVVEYPALVAIASGEFDYYVVAGELTGHTTWRHPECSPATT